MFMLLFSFRGFLALAGTMVRVDLRRYGDTPNLPTRIIPIKIP